MLVCAGCSDLAVFLGLRTRLDKLPVTSITATLVTKKTSQPVTALAPGHEAPLVVVASTSDGRQFITAGAGHGKVLFDSFTFTPALVQIDSHGKVSLPADPRISEGKIATLHIDKGGASGCGHRSAYRDHSGSGEPGPVPTTVIEPVPALW